MPRYIKVDDIPEILRELQTYGSGKTPYQLNEWQGRRCHITNKPEEVSGIPGSRCGTYSRFASLPGCLRGLLKLCDHPK